MISDPSPHRRDGLVRYDSAPETFLYDEGSDVVHVLNPTALAVWELCDGAHTPAQMARYLETHFAGVPAGAADEAVREALVVFGQKALIRWSSIDKEDRDE